MGDELDFASANPTLWPAPAPYSFAAADIPSETEIEPAAEPLSPSGASAIVLPVASASVSTPPSLTLTDPNAAEIPPGIGDEVAGAVPFASITVGIWAGAAAPGAETETRKAELPSTASVTCGSPGRVIAVCAGSGQSD